MNIPFYVWHILVEVLATFGAVLGAVQVNTSWKLPEDDYLPRKRRKIGKLFVFIAKKRPVRWRAYWMHRIAQINILLYIVFFLTGIIITKSLEFIHETLFLYYPVVMAFYNLLWEIGIFVYIKYKKMNSSS